MSQSLYTAMGGISAATTQLQVVSNNVANINTTAFKSSSVTFSDVFSRTLSSGSVATDSNGGTNPVQIGVGVQVSAVSKDFSTGSWVSTGQDTDLMIEGSGFFTVTDGTSVFYTRAGDFSFDEDGNLVTSDGYKVLGTNSIMSTTTSQNTVSVPLSICADVEGNASIGTIGVNNLNNLDNNFTAGDFTITSTGAAGATYTISLDATDLDGDVNELVAAIQNDIGDEVATGITVECSDGQITFTIDGGNATSLEFNTPTVDASNFVTQTELKGSAPNGGVYSSKNLDYTANISQLSSASEAISETSETINSDGSVQVTYNDGSILSVQLGEDNTTYEFIYTTADNVKITGTKCNVESDVAEPANFVIQLGTITNTNGLMSKGSNLFEAGPNSGDIVYTVAGEMGAGYIESGGLEASNVNLSSELSNMILAQRAIQANSRVFTTTTNVMDTITQMGR